MGTRYDHRHAAQDARDAAARGESERVTFHGTTPCSGIDCSLASRPANRVIINGFPAKYLAFAERSTRSRTDARRTGPRLRRSTRALAPRGRTRSTRGTGRARSVHIPRLVRSRALRRQGGKSSSPLERAFRRSTMARAAPSVGGRRGDRVATSRVRDRGASARSTACPRSATTRERPNRCADAGHESHSTLPCPGCRAAGAVDRSDAAELVAARDDGATMLHRTRRSSAELARHHRELWMFFTRRSGAAGDGSAPLVFSWLAGRGVDTTRLNPHDSASARQAAISWVACSQTRAFFPSDLSRSRRTSR